MSRYKIHDPVDMMYYMTMGVVGNKRGHRPNIYYIKGQRPIYEQPRSLI